MPVSTGWSARCRDWGRDCYCEPGIQDGYGRRFSQKHGALPEGYDHKYVFSHVGYNLKLKADPSGGSRAATGKAAWFYRSRKRNFRLLLRGLEPWRQFLRLPSPTRHSDPSWFAFPLTLEQDARSAALTGGASGETWHPDPDAFCG